MAITKLVDIIEPAVYLKYQKEYKPDRLDLLNSGIIAPTPPEVASQMTAGGSRIDLPFWQDVSRTEPNVMSDNDAVNATPEKVTSTKMQAQKLYRHQSWSAMRLAGIVATGTPGDPLKGIVDYTSRYWEAVRQITLIKALDGILADNVANDAADMRYTIYSDIASPLAANKISPAAVNRARFTMGHSMDELTTLVMHSKVYTDALDQENITFVQPDKLPFKISMFSGVMVMVTDDCTTVAGANSPKYRTYMFGKNAVCYDSHLPEDSVEAWRFPERGNGGGQDVLHNRRHELMHPYGFQFTAASMAGKSPTWAELTTTANWNRVYDRKNCRIAYLETN